MVLKCTLLVVFINYLYIDGCGFLDDWVIYFVMNQYKFVILANVSCIFLVMLYKFILYGSVTERMHSSGKSLPAMNISYSNQDTQ